MPTLFFRGTDGIFGTAGNWKDITGANGTPASDDTLIFDRLSGSLTSNAGSLDQSALTGITLYIYKEFTGTIGAISAAGVPTYFQIDAVVVEIGGALGQGGPAGSPLILLDVGNAGGSTCVCRIFDSATTSNDTYRPPIQLKGTALTIIQTGGNASVSPRDAETSTITLQAGANGEASVEPQMLLGRGVTRTAIEVASGATILDYSNQTATSIINNGGEITTFGTGAITAAENYAGTLDIRGTGTITTLRNGGTVDFSKDARAKTVTNFEVYKGATVDLRNGNPFSVTVTNGIDFIRCQPDDVTIHTEPHITLSMSSV